MKSPAPHKPLYALPNYLFGFRKYCKLPLDEFEQGLFSTFEYNRQRGHDVQLIYNLTGSVRDDELFDRLIFYVRWLDHLRPGLPLNIAVLTTNRRLGEEFALNLFGRTKVYTPHNLISGVGRTFDVVFILDAQNFRRCRADYYHYTYFQQSLYFFGYARFLFIFGEYSSRGRLAESFHVHYRRALAVQQQEPEIHTVFSRTDPNPHPGRTVPLPATYTLPELRPRPEQSDDEDYDTEIVLGYTIGLPPEHFVVHALDGPRRHTPSSPEEYTPPLAMA